MTMKRSIAPLLTETTIILLIVGMVAASLVAYHRSGGPAPLSNWEKEKVSLSQKTSALERENRTLRESVRALEADLAERAASTGSRADPLIDIKELQERRDRAQTSARTATVQVAKTRKALAALEEQLDRKKTQLETMSRAAAAEEAAQAGARESLRKEVEKLTRQETTAAKRAEAAGAELVRVNQALARLETTLGERQAELKTLSEEVAHRENASKQTARTLASEIEALKIQRELAERQVDAGKSQAERLRREVDALQTKLRADQARFKSVEDAIRRRKAALETLPSPRPEQTPAQATNRNLCLEAWARVAAEPKARARLAELREKIAAAETELCELNKRRAAAKESLGPPTNEPDSPRQEP